MGRTIFMRDVAHVHGWISGADQLRLGQWNAGRVDDHCARTGGVSTLAVINGVRAALKDIKRFLPPDVAIQPLFDQSVFVKAALNSVGLSAGMAAALTALVIILFLATCACP